MPILEIRKVSSSRSVALWKITENYETLYEQSSLRGNEIEVVRSYRSEIKQREWLAGRLTVRELLHHLCLEYDGIKKNENGKPVLLCKNGEVSLTHSYPYVAVVYDQQEDVGIDLEQPTPKLQLISKKFLSESELASTKDDITKLCIYWCAKEALYKIYSQRGLIFKENLFIHPFEVNKAGVMSGSIIVNNTEKKYNLQYNVEQDYVLVYNF